MTFQNKESGDGVTAVSRFFIFMKITADRQCIKETGWRKRRILRIKKENLHMLDKKRGKTYRSFVAR